MMPSTRSNQLLALLLVASTACGDEAPPPAAAKPKAATRAAAPAETPAAGKNADAAASPRAKERATRVLTREDFGPLARDPFQMLNMVEEPETQVEAQQVRQREVVLPNYDLNDLRLIAIVKSSATIHPRALFVGSDGMSKAVQQGEYFSRNEVLLAAVNNDYIEIEIVDEEMAKVLNMARGERRAIYIRKD